MRNPLLVIARQPFGYRLLLRYATLVELCERLLRRLSKGKFGVLDLASVPSIRLLIPGRRSGRVRTTTLQCIEVEGRLVVVGSNWGRPTHPAWSANLQAVETVQVWERTGDYEADVQEIVNPERSSAWAAVLRSWPNYELAQRMAPDRPFRIFALTRRAPSQ